MSTVTLLATHLSTPNSCQLVLALQLLPWQLVQFPPHQQIPWHTVVDSTHGKASKICTSKNVLLSFHQSADTFNRCISNRPLSIAKSCVYFRSCTSLTVNSKYVQLHKLVLSVLWHCCLGTSMQVLRIIALHQSPKIFLTRALESPTQPRWPVKIGLTRNKSIVPCWTMHTGRMSCHSTKNGVNYYVSNYHV